MELENKNLFVGDLKIVLIEIIIIMCYVFVNKLFIIQNSKVD
jgi:hypothetical protein